MAAEPAGAGSADAILYRDDYRPSVAEFVDVLRRSGLSERRPVDDLPRMTRMLSAFTFVCTAWDDGRLVGIATVWTDYAFSAYLADLAVDLACQGRGIGRQLIDRSHRKSGRELTTLHLLSAPGAVSFYEQTRMQRFGDCFLIRRER